MGLVLLRPHAHPVRLGVAVARTTRIGTVYLIHFNRPLGHAQHYLGWAVDHEARIQAHAKGKGARLMAAVVRAGISYQVAKLWHGVDRHFERRLKNRGSHRRICPICK